MRSYSVRSVALFVAVCFLATCEGEVGPTGPAGADGDPGIVNYTADMNEANVTVPTGSIATGTASFSVAGQSLLYSITVADLTDVTKVHIHGPAAPGSDAGIVQSLCIDDDAPLCETGTVNGVLVAGAANYARIPFDSLLVLMGNGMAYVNVHTLVNGGGEIRGQIALVP